MRSDEKISTGTFSAIIFMASVSFIGSFSMKSAAGSLSDAAIAAAASTLVIILLALPLIKYRSPSSAELLTADVGKTEAAIYVLFFIFCAVSDVSAMIYMMQNTVFRSMEALLFSLIFSSSAVYCCCLGLETLGRSAVFLTGFVAVSVVLIFLSSLKHVEPDNLSLPFYEGSKEFSLNFGSIASQLMLLPQVLFLAEGIEKGKSRLGFSAAVCLPTLLAGALCVGVITLTSLCLGDFAEIQEFPIFTLSSYLDLEPLQRMDVFHGIVLLSANFVRLSLNLYAIKKCMAVIYPKPGSGSIVFPGLMIAALAALCAGKPALQKVVGSPELIGIPGIVLGVILPQLRNSAWKIKLKKEGQNEN